MNFRSKKFAFVSVLILVSVITDVNCKRGGGGRRGGSTRASSSIWGRNKSSRDDSHSSRQKNKNQEIEPLPPPGPPPKPKPAVKPSAPQSSAPDPKSSSNAFISNEKTQSAAAAQNVQSGQRPIGWDVGQGTGFKNEPNINKNAGWNVGTSNTNYKTPGSSNNPYPHNSGGYPYGSNYPNNFGTQHAPSYVGHYPNTGSSNYYGTGSSYNYGNNYPTQHNPHQPFSGYNPASNVANPGSYYNSYNGMGNAPMPINHQRGGGGMFGSLFGGQRHGYGGYGGYGGYSGYGGYGGYGSYGMGGWGKPRGGFGSGFGRHTVRNVLGGLLLWYVISGTTSRLYQVHNYYNKPEQVPAEISLPADIITLCAENATSLCAPNTLPLCTTNNTILCVASVQSTIPCGENITLNCINSTLPCVDDKGDPCEDTTNNNATETISLPCISNATILGDMLTSNLHPNIDHNNVLCVTTVALPQPNTTVPCTNYNSTQSENLSDTTLCASNSTDVVTPIMDPINLNNTSKSVAT